MPPAESVRLRNSFAEVLRRQAAEVLLLVGNAPADEAVLDAVRHIVLSMRDTAKVLDAEEVERACARAAEEAGGPRAHAAMEHLLDVCRALDGIAPALRPMVVVAERGQADELRIQAAALGAPIRVVEDVAGAWAVAREEGMGALVLPVGALRRAVESEPARMADVTTFAYGEDGDLGGRVQAAQAGATGFLPRPLDLAEAARRVREHAIPGQRGPWRVLVVEKDGAHAERTAAALRWPDTTVTAVHGAKQLLPALDRALPDLVVLAADMAGPSPQDLAKVLKAHHRHAAVPRIFLVAPGATRVLVKEAHGVFLRGQEDEALLARAVGLMAQSRRERAMREFDEGVGALSRPAILRAAEREIALARRAGGVLAVMRVGTDGMERVRRRSGAEGEAIVRRVASCLRSATRPYDSIGLIGESGFVILLPGMTARQARVRFAVVQQRWEKAGPTDGDKLLLSAGIADSRSSADDLLVRAERLLLQARAAGAGMVAAEDAGAAE